MLLSKYRHKTMKKCRLYQVDSFTTDLFRGNPAGVVPDADGLTAAQMQAIAREMNNSETAFILSPTAPITQYGFASSRTRLKFRRADTRRLPLTTCVRWRWGFRLAGSSR